MSDHHVHQHGHQTFGEANKEYMDKIAATWEEADWWKKVTAQMTDFLRSKVDWIGAAWVSPDENKEKPRHEVWMLDYACGSGMLTRSFAPWITHSLGVDVSPAMIARFNEQLATSGLPEGNITTFVGDLLSTPPTLMPHAPVCDFDVIAIGLAFHHFPDPHHALQRLTSKLKPNGVLVITDFLAPDESVPQGLENYIKSGGFKGEDVMRKYCEQAGLVDFGFSAMEEDLKMCFNDEWSEKRMFVVKARMPEKSGVEQP